jgi:PPM family protein phosphatase
MEPTRDNLLPIGTFASRTYLSVKALRLYAQLGLLVPVYVDPDSGYRYYHADQLQRARLIRLIWHAGDRTANRLGLQPTDQRATGRRAQEPRAKPAHSRRRGTARRYALPLLIDHIAH